MDDFISHSSWMKDIPDDARLLSLSIPGTHNSCSIGGVLGFSKTQNLDLPEQLNGGIRFLDIRLSHYQDNLFVHHDVVYMGKSYGDVLTACSSFLKRNPSEVILMSVKDEGRRDRALGRFAPSRVFGKSRGDPMNWVIRSSSFEDAFKARTWEHVDDPLLFYNFPCPLPGVSTTCVNLAPDTTLGEVRGKILLLRRFEASQDVGFDLTYWLESTRFRSATSPAYAVEDHWWDPGEGDKYDFIITHMEEARRRGLRDLYITFSSAVTLNAHAYSKTINPRLNDYLAKSSPGRVGIIAMDYFEQPRELVSNIIKTNFAADVEDSVSSSPQLPPVTVSTVVEASDSDGPAVEISPDWDRLLMEVALEEARASLLAGGLPVGAVLAGGETLVRGHDERIQNDDPTAHGEIACLRRAGCQVNYDNTTLYTTLSPCEMCTGAILLFKIPRVVVGESTTSRGDLDRLRERGVEVVLLNDDSCMQLMNRFREKYPQVWLEGAGGIGLR